MKVRLMFVAVAVLLWVPAVLFAGAKAELWERWTVSDEKSEEVVDHSLWQSFLDDYREIDPVDDIAKIRYGEVSVADAALLDQYVSTLEGRNVDALNAGEQFAFWVNLYNAATTQLILREYPVASIRRISEPWDQKLLRVGEEDISLNDIEHRILRPRWQDARIHFVVNCASIGCPDVPPQVLTADSAESILEAAATAYLNHPRAVAYSGRKLILSSIFDWYAEDFGEAEGVLTYISRYRDLDQLLRGSGKSLSQLAVRYDYDWDLNELP